MSRNPVNRTVWLALLLTIPALLPLAAPGYFLQAHDARHSIFYLVELDRAFRDGALWPVWGADHALGFGYPLWLIYAPLAYLVAEGFHLLLGLGYVAAIKATWALCFIVGALGMYRLARRWWGTAAALVASIAFTYAPYHLVQVYVRGALAEFAALAWLPWVLLAFVELWAAPRARRAAWAAIAFGLLLLSHTVSTLTFVPLIGGYLLLKTAQAWRRNRSGASLPLRAAVGWSAVALCLGSVLASVFLLPMLAERGFIVQSQWINATYDYRQHFVYPSQFFDPGWGYGFSVAGADDGMSFQLGLIGFLGAAIGFFAALRRRDSLTPHRAEALFLALAAGIALFAMMPAARRLWDVMPLVSLVQFPWRLLAPVVATLALLAGAGAAWLDTRGSARETPGAYAYVFALAILAGGFVFTRPELMPVQPRDESPLAVLDFEMEFPDMRGMTRWSERLPENEDSPLIAQYEAGQPLQRAAIAAGQGAIIEQRASALSAYARVRADSDVTLRFYTYFFPGWLATVDGQPAKMAPEPPNGLITLQLPPGEHEVTLRFGATPLRRVAQAISLLALIFTGLLWFVGPRLEERRGSLRSSGS
jgi:hypothetical protein